MKLSMLSGLFSRVFLARLAVFGLAVPLAAAQVKVERGVEPRYQVTGWSSEDGLPHNRINALAQTPDGYLWAGTWFGLARFDGVRFFVFDQANTPAMTAQEINALAVDTEGALWIGTADGLLRFRDGHFTRFGKSDGLPARTVWRLIPSRNGGVWLHCGSSHVLHWKNDRVTVVARVVSAPNEGVRSLREETDGCVTVATSHAIVRVKPDGEMQPDAVRDFPGIPNADWGGAWRSRGCLWISAQEGLWLQRDRSWKQVLSGDCRANLGTFMYEDRSGWLWVNRREAGFWRCAGETAEPVKFGERGAEKSVGCMLETAEGHIWLGTAEGLFQFRPTLIRAVTAEQGLPHDQCRSVGEGPDGAIWVEYLENVMKKRGDWQALYTACKELAE
jgi:ligand-binding sensor domain-containing protein